MSNWISNQQAQEGMALSNGAMAVFISLIILAGSDLAQTPWEKACMTWLAERDQAIFGLGMVGFDLSELAWTHADFEKQKDFLMRTLKLALTRHRWDCLNYDPPSGSAYLLEFHRVLSSFTPAMIGSENDWQWFDPPQIWLKCSHHQVYEHANGCQICHDMG